MRCPCCGTDGRVLFGWVSVRKDGSFYETLICHACDNELIGDDLEPDSPEVQGHLADIEEEGLKG